MLRVTPNSVGCALPAALAAALLMTAPGVPRARAAPAADTASSAGADLQHGRVLYLQHCAVCHGARAWGDGPREIPLLAGQREAYLSAQLTRFASGARPGSATHGPAMFDTLRAAPDVNREPAIRDLAAYLARAPAAPQADQGEGRALTAGRNAYLRSCAACHGEDGAGSEGVAAPRIGGQHFRYLLSRLREFAAVHRGESADTGLSAQQQQAVADYLSRLSPLPAARAPRP